ncbi:hypothetical protein [uncultured Rhodoferax sp.]|uniref:hypothetical protein n=1 Tax=uncultured Rhodoferax sp. TaxID=223188 RepID=UPI0025EFD60D|nr:hypothetical protein [uncultured Rhodoferax sp.]
MTDAPKTFAPPMPAFVVVETKADSGASPSKCWKPLAVVDFYRAPSVDLRLRELLEDTEEHQ